MARKRKVAAAPMNPRYTVLRDTSEKEGHGWWFDESDSCVGTVKRNLYTADYSLEGYYDDKTFVIERKGSVSEFAGNISQKDKWDDFKQVLERMEEFKHTFLILEFPFRLVSTYPVGSDIPRKLWSRIRVTPQFLLKRLAEIQLRFKTQIVFIGPDQKDYVSSLFKRITEAYPRDPRPLAPSPT